MTGLRVHIGCKCAACRCLYRDGVLESEGFDSARISDYLKDPAAAVWFDLCEPTVQDLAAVSEELGLHHLAVEDALYSRASA